MNEAPAQTKGDFAHLERGLALDPFELRVTAADVQLYLGATGEQNELWDTRVPPLMLGAFALGGLMDRFQVPGGLVHTGQEYDFVEAVAVDEPVEVQIVVASNSERRGTRMVVFAIELRAHGATVGTGRTTVMLVPDGLEAELMPE